MCLFTSEHHCTDEKVYNRFMNSSNRLMKFENLKKKDLLVSLFLFIDINECDSSPCENGARCEDGVNEFTCVCEPGWEGSRCETGEFV